MQRVLCSSRLTRVCADDRRADEDLEFIMMELCEFVKQGITKYFVEGVCVAKPTKSRGGVFDGNSTSSYSKTTG